MAYEEDAQHASFFTNRECEFFPCHEGVDPENFNCLFCYCPLYALGPNCGGAFRYLENGVKSCDRCALPHIGTNGCTMVAERFNALADLASRKRDAC